MSAKPVTRDGACPTHALLKMNQKAFRVLNLFGIEVTHREIPLDISMPKISGRVTGTIKDVSELRVELEYLKKDPVDYFGLILKSIRYMNRISLTDRARYRLVREIIEIYFVPAQKEMAQHTRNGGIPDLDEGSKILDSIIDITDLLLGSAKILFSRSYQKKYAFRFGSLTRLHQLGFLLLELLLMKQKAKALRYQLMEEQDWKDLNTLMCVLSVNVDIFKKRQTLHGKFELEGKSEVSLAEFFALAQALKRYDLRYWPATLQWIIGSYFFSMNETVGVQRYLAQNPGKESILALCTHAVEEGTAEPPSSQPAVGLVIDFSRLEKLMRSDIAKAAQGRRRPELMERSSRLDRFNRQDQLTISELLLRGLDPDHSLDDNKIIQDVANIKVFVGFREIFERLCHEFGYSLDEFRLEDALAKRSATIVKDQRENRESLWTLTAVSSHGLRIETRETEFTKRIRIGSLLICEQMKSKDDQGRVPQAMGFVVRIGRSFGRIVEIDVDFLSSYVEPVAIGPNNALRRKPAMILRNKNEFTESLLLPTQLEVVSTAEPVTLLRKGITIQRNLKDCVRATQEFSLHPIVH